MTSIYIEAAADPNNTLKCEDLYAKIVSLRPGCANQSLIINMRAVHFVYVDALLALTSVVRLWWQWSGCKVLLKDIPFAVHRYLERIDFFEKCSEWLEQDYILDPSERFERKPHSERLLEVTPIPSDEVNNAVVVREAVDRIRLILDNATNRDADTVGGLCTILSEITQNVVHSLDRGFAVVQRYRTSGLVPGYRVMIGVVDLGIGIETSLRRGGGAQLMNDHGTPLASGSDYILKALDLGVSSRASAGGIGLNKVRRLVEKWQGALTIRSQRSSVHITSSSVTRVDDLVEIPGTHVTILVQGS